VLKPDILVNNLGVYQPEPFEQITDAEWPAIIETNFQVTDELAPLGVALGCIRWPNGGAGQGGRQRH
jgi:NAD(P)-dependent dehydrogenase (short-subunit alcohol dehydrogenase family)